MLNKIILLVAVIFSVLNVGSAYACQTDGCSGWAYGPVVIAETANTYIVVALQDTVTAGVNTPSGADDNACQSNGVFGPVYSFASFFGINSEGRSTNLAIAQSESMLQMLTAAQSGSNAKTQLVAIWYTWDSRLNTCLITGTGYYNP